MSLLLGLDIGTSATKGVLLDPASGVLAQAERPMELATPHPAWAEQDPAAWWENVCSLCRELGQQHEIAAVGFSGMVPALVLLDAAGRPLRPSIQQNDARASVEVEELRTELAGSRILERTGSAVTQQSVGPTARWLDRHEPALWEKADTILGSYDYLTFRLTGERGVERNWALESGLYDLETDRWAPDVCAAAGIDPDLLPPVRRADEVVGGVTSAAAAATGLRTGIPVVAGSADHVASAFAAGLVRDGDLLVKLGSAGDILLSTDEPLVDERLYLDFHLVPGKYLPNGCMASSGTFIRWFQRELANGLPLEQLDAEAAHAGPGAGGIVALPYLLGEKTPINDPSARGAFVGLHLGHRRGHLFRAVLEATAFGFRHHLDVFAELGRAPRRVRVTNGGARSELWKQVVADVLQRRLETVVGGAGSEVGAAFAAGIGVGLIDSWDRIEQFVTLGEPVEPDAALAPMYDDQYAAYRKLYPLLSPIEARP